MTESENIEALIAEMQDLRVAARELIERSEMLLKKSDELQHKILGSFCRYAFSRRPEMPLGGNASRIPQVSKIWTA